MFTSIFGWLQSLSIAGKIAVVTLGLGTVAAVANQDTPNTGDDEAVAGASSTVISVPKITKETLTETQVLPFEKTSIESADLNKGESRITTVGVEGVKTTTYEVTKTDGVETSRVLTSEVVTREPVTEVTTVGTYVKPAEVPRSSCDPNYAGACVPIASDVDCGGGSGNGPAYVYGTVTVIGTDIYGLDRDGDGYGCE